MDIIIFIASYLLLSIIGSLTYVGFVLLFFSFMKKRFNMNEVKWNTVFSYRKGKGLYYILIFPYVLTIAFIFFLSIAWFNFINFEYKIVAVVSLLLITTISAVVKFSKLRGMLPEKFQSNY
ncbi:hypothetical protein [Ornithinibacillus halotolerans]|uniref:Uncharacterized protein n=1 Tax=Ornithinibacillus halotolerans TaxID=1274357 RepID=A0A916RNU6_9BACI|nr:hypothetical protein [Ornithinibacillus halotolerans]GGA64230.1 hypothetical protein GCM10008025_05060 [Ornithinibacillus halotolerans]